MRGATSRAVERRVAERRAEIAQSLADALPDDVAVELRDGAVVVEGYALVRRALRDPSLHALVTDPRMLL